MSASAIGGSAAARPTADGARRRVLQQHVELRHQLDFGLEQVRAMLAGEGGRHLPLRMLVGATYQTFVQHLADEEALVLPILENDLPLGPLRADRLREEHDRQCAEFAALYGARESGDPIDMATRFDALAHALLIDIEHEERELLTPDVIRDDNIVIDQSGG